MLRWGWIDEPDVDDEGGAAAMIRAQHAAYAAVRGDHGSLSGERLQRLRRRLRDAATRCDAEYFIIDLGACSYFGAGLLGVLAEVGAQRFLMGKRFAVCGVMSFGQQLIRQAGLEQSWDVYRVRADAERGVAAELSDWRESMP